MKPTIVSAKSGRVPIWRMEERRGVKLNASRLGCHDEEIGVPARGSRGAPALGSKNSALLQLEDGDVFGATGNWNRVERQVPNGPCHMRPGMAFSSLESRIDRDLDHEKGKQADLGQNYGKTVVLSHGRTLKDTERI
jgi:hypothetical protein